MHRLIPFIILILLLPSCGHVISRQNRAGTLSGVSFSAVRSDPDAFLQSRLILGGTIMETTTKEKGAEIEVIQHPIDRFGYIIDPDLSDGRFLVSSDRQLDPLIFKQGRQVTISGILVGSAKRRLGEAEYRYPVLEAREIHLWKEPGPYPAGPYPYWYDPYWPYRPYPYWYDPYWPRPHIYPRSWYY